ncbi:DUF1822 family protein [Scytonema sp. PRP1]|uniref:DUF1822 family protein n=1 Tax=Scytonema sp. PRP1 TaxID=3120513 RepID=UPI002FD24151
MINSKEHLSVTLPLTPEAHRIAEEFWEYHDSQKSKEVYMNTLAVYTVRSYLQMLGIQTDLEASDSWNYSMQSRMNIADLWVTNMGKLECRPVWPKEQECPIPLEVRQNRIGYVVVQISDSLSQATILGFSQTALTGNLRIDELQSLEYLIELLKEPVNLSQWFENVFEACWQTVEAFLNPEQDVLGFSFRSAQELRANEPDNSAVGVRRAKLIELGNQSARQQVVLVVGLTPAADPELNVWVEVYPRGDQTYLSCGLHLMLLNEKGSSFFRKAIEERTNNIQVKFSGKPGERFSIIVALGDVSITKAFLI